MVFRPKGHTARWKIIYEQLMKLNIGDTLTYEDMGRALGLDHVAERVKIQGALHQAIPHFEEDARRAVDRVTNVGYRVVGPKDQLRLVHSQQGRAHFALQRASSLAKNVDLTHADQQTRKAFEVVGLVLGAQMELASRMEARADRIEKVLEAVVGTQVESNTSMENLEARLARLERDRREH